MSAKSNKKNKGNRHFFENRLAVTVVAVFVLILLFIGSFFITTVVIRGVQDKENNTTTEPSDITEPEIPSDLILDFQPVSDPVDEPDDEQLPADETTTASVAQSTTSAPDIDDTVFSPGTISYPSDTASWQLICLNKSRCVDSGYESSLSLSYVAGSGEQMDSRAAAAYEKMYAAAAADGIYLTPCSGYRSYSTQKRLFNEFVNEYLAQGYSQQEAYELTSTRRNPPGSSEHNIGICMDIICAASSANFENTRAYAWLQNNAADYGFILRYPADKVDITGVKFEPWHWRYVGVENANAIKASGLCLEEYLGVQ